jgi:hypothetical protein
VITATTPLPTGTGSADYVQADERIAVFDNDGTLWGRAADVRAGVLRLRSKQSAGATAPRVDDDRTVRICSKGDVKTALAGGEKAFAQLGMATDAGMTSDEFDAIVRDWIGTAKHPQTHRPFTETAYQPARSSRGIIDRPYATIVSRSRHTRTRRRSPSLPSDRPFE